MTRTIRLALIAAALVSALVASGCKKEDAPPPVGAAPPPAAPSSQPAGGAQLGMAPGEHHEEHGKAAGDRDLVDADGVVRRGAPLTKELETVTVTAAVQRGKELDGKKVKLQGKVTDVCTKMGCWFVVQGDKPEDSIRISTKSHSIFVPMKAVGMAALVEGTLSVRTISKETAQHYEDERALKPGETKKTFTADVTEVYIDVAGLEMKPS